MSRYLTAEVRTSITHPNEPREYNLNVDAGEYVKKPIEIADKNVRTLKVGACAIEAYIHQSPKSVGTLKTVHMG